MTKSTNRSLSKRVTSPGWQADNLRDISGAFWQRAIINCGCIQEGFVLRSPGPESPGTKKYYQQRLNFIQDFAITLSRSCKATFLLFHKLPAHANVRKEKKKSRFSLEGKNMPQTDFFLNYGFHSLCRDDIKTDIWITRDRYGLF